MIRSDLSCVEVDADAGQRNMSASLSLLMALQLLKQHALLVRIQIEVDGPMAAG